MARGYLESGRISGVGYRFHRVGKVIPVKRKAYRATGVKRVDWEALQ
jgi:hypothetical protein